MKDLAVQEISTFNYSRSHRADETAITTLQNSMLNKLGVILRKVSVVLVKTARATDTIGRANVWCWSIVSASRM